MIYLSGPHQADEYRRIANEYFARVGIGVLDPMRPERDFRGIADITKMAAEVVRGDLEDIVNSKVILSDFSQGVQATGTAMENWFAFSIGKPIVVYYGEHRLSPWTAYIAGTKHCFYDLVPALTKAHLLHG